MFILPVLCWVQVDECGPIFVYQVLISRNRLGQSQSQVTPEPVPGHYDIKQTVVYKVQRTYQIARVMYAKRRAFMQQLEDNTSAIKQPHLTKYTWRITNSRTTLTSALTVFDHQTEWEFRLSVCGIEHPLSSAWGPWDKHQKWRESAITAASSSLNLSYNSIHWSIRSLFSQILIPSCLLFDRILARYENSNSHSLRKQWNRLLSFRSSAVYFMKWSTWFGEKSGSETEPPIAFR